MTTSTLPPTMSGVAYGVDACTGQLTVTVEGAGDAPSAAMRRETDVGTFTVQSSDFVPRCWSSQRSAPSGSGCGAAAFRAGIRFAVASTVDAVVVEGPAIPTRWYRSPESHAVTSAVRPYAANTVPLPSMCRRCWPGWAWSAAPGTTTYRTSLATCVATTARGGGSSTVRWAMPSAIIPAATTKATSASTNRMRQVFPPAASE